MLALPSAFILSSFLLPSLPKLSYPTVNVLGRFVGVILYDHLDEVHALNDEALKGHSLASGCEHIAHSKFQGTLDEGNKRTWMVLQEVQQLHSREKERHIKAC